MTRVEFIVKYYGDAKRATKNTGLFPEVLLIQAILESMKSNGSLSTLASKYKNYFGIKADRSWTGQVVSLTTPEYVNNIKKYYTGTGKTYTNRNEAIKQGANQVTFFRVYNTTQEGFADRTKFLQNNKRYVNVFKAANPVSQFVELQKAGYATAPNYSAVLTSVYNTLKPQFETLKKMFASIPGTLTAAIPLVFFCFF